jgi:argininosuccinate lyase
VATDFRLFVKDAIASIMRNITAVEQAFLGQARRASTKVILPGLTHMQPAQPVLLAHHLLAYVEMLERDKGRFADCLKRADVLPLGSGALAGTAYAVNRNFVAKQLGFKKVSANSMDAVSDRDFAVEFLAASALLAAHISRWCEELVLWSHPSFAFVALDESYATGSSMLPQKKNPDTAELLRGKAGRVFGHLMGMLTVLKGLPMTYNRDLQEDKEPVFDTADVLEKGLPVLAGMVKTLKFNAQAMREAAGQGYLLAIDAAGVLVRKGVPFRDAHKIAGRIVRECEKRDITLRELPLSEWKKFSPHFEKDILAAMDLESSLAARKSAGGTAPEKVAQAIREAEKRILK